MLYFRSEQKSLPLTARSRTVEKQGVPCSATFDIKSDLMVGFLTGDISTKCLLRLKR
jgi:hypothetical protein